MTQLVVILCYLGLLIGLGLLSQRLARGNTSDFFLAERSIGPFFLLMSLFGTTMTAFALVGSTGKAFTSGIGVYGLMASISCIVHPAVFFIIGIKLWALGKKNGYMTQIQFFRDRLESNHIGIVLFPILIGLLIPYLLIGVMASGTIINVMTTGAFPEFFRKHDGGLPEYLGSALICLVVMFYIFVGGMRGAAWANTFQTIVFMIVAVFAFGIIASKLGGVEQASRQVIERNPSKFKRTVDPSDITRFNEEHARWEMNAKFDFLRNNLSDTQKDEAYAAYTGKKVGPWQTAAETAYISTTGMTDTLSNEDNELAISLFRAKSENYELAAHTMFEKQINDPDPGKRWSRKKAEGVYRSKYFEPIQPHGIGIWEFLTYLFIPLSVGMFPHLFQHWLTAKSAKSFRLSVIAHPLCIMLVWVPCVLIGAWATSAVITDGPRAGQLLVSPFLNPNAVLPFMIEQLTTGVVGGLLAAGILAAIMSSLDSQFLCLSNIFTNDIVLHYNKSNTYTDTQKVLIGRGFVVAIVIITYLFSLAEPRSVFSLGIWCFSGFGALCPIVFAAIYWPRLTRAGTYAAVLATSSCWLVMFARSGFGNSGGKEYMIHLTPEIAVMPVTIMFAVCLVTMIIVSLATKPPARETLIKFFPAEKCSDG
jgi:SSS family solute:Na+ symporter